MTERRDGHGDERPVDEGLVDEQETAAAREAAKIGGPDPEPGVDPEQRAVVEGGGGYAEGFEQAEEQLERNASHEDRGADPLRDAGEDEERTGAEFGEADHVGAQGEEEAGRRDDDR
jgi:hypothetical protein